VTRRYRFILSDRFLQERNLTSYPPQPLHPDGSVTSSASFLVPDQKALAFRLLREDTLNGTYMLSPAKSTPTRLVFESLQLDGAPATWKAREILEVVSPTEHVETLEVAEGDKPFTLRTRIVFKKN
jgi:hypothetical protein